MALNWREVEEVSDWTKGGIGPSRVTVMPRVLDKFHHQSKGASSLRQWTVTVTESTHKDL